MAMINSSEACWRKRWDNGAAEPVMGFFWDGEGDKTGRAHLLGAVFSLTKVLRSLGKAEGKLARECGAILSFVSRSV